MFLCRKCLEVEKVSVIRRFLLPKSLGQCEMCGEKKLCYDWKDYKRWGIE